MSSKLSSNTASLQSILEAVNNLPNGAEGDTNTSDATATAEEIFQGKTAYAQGRKLTGTFTIDEELNTQDDLIAQISAALEGKAAGGVALPTLINPGAAGDLLLNKQLIDGSGNIVEGTFTIDEELTTQNDLIAQLQSMVDELPEANDGIDTSDATASASEILSGETAYVNGSKITGTMTNNGAISSTMDGINTKSINVPEGYTSGGTISLDNTIDNEASEQSDLIDQIIAKANSLPDASSGGGSSDDSVPAGYVRADYVQFNAAQTVDTGIICNQNTKIKLRFVRESDSAMYLYGISSSGNTASVTAYLSTSGSWRFGNGSKSLTINTDDAIHTAVISKTSVIIDGATTYAYGTINDFTAPGALTIGSCRNADGSLGTAQFIGKLLTFEIWQGEELVLQLIPVVSTEGAYRLFDKVSNNFLDSATTTALTGGRLYEL